MVLPRRRIAAALATATVDPRRAPSPALEVVTAATLVAIVIVRRPEATERATLWATDDRGAITRRITEDRYSIQEVGRDLLAAHACRLAGIGAGLPADGTARTLHRSGLERWRIGSEAVERHWEFSIVWARGGDVSTASLEAVTLAGGGIHEVTGDAWITLTPVAGDAMRSRVAAAFGD